MNEAYFGMLPFRHLDASSFSGGPAAICSTFQVVVLTILRVIGAYSSLSDSWPPVLSLVACRYAVFSQ
ncbi:hypothetical protein AB1N83_012659 [Pleurotus pulmonarius]